MSATTADPPLTIVDMVTKVRAADPALAADTAGTVAAVAAAYGRTLTAQQVISANETLRRQRRGRRKRSKQSTAKPALKSAPKPVPKPVPAAVPEIERQIRMAACLRIYLEACRDNGVTPAAVATVMRALREEAACADCLRVVDAATILCCAE